ncbi:MAG: hypothetical protein JXR96_21620 [Deltaproteobacteria bacterium]|nr:hypothetical protein [Deltaproteobacteria bacterium]
MKTRAKMIMGLVGCLGLVCFVACGDSDGEEDTYTLSGNAILSSAPDGVIAYLKLVVSGGSGNAEALYYAVSEPFSGGQAAYSVSGIEAGSYTGHAFVDMNGNAAGDGSSMPDSGDYVSSEGHDILIDGDKQEDIPEAAWILYPGP